MDGFIICAKQDGLCVRQDGFIGAERGRPKRAKAMAGASAAQASSEKEARMASRRMFGRKAKKDRPSGET